LCLKTCLQNIKVWTTKDLVLEVGSICFKVGYLSSSYLILLFLLFSFCYLYSLFCILTRYPMEVSIAHVQPKRRKSSSSPILVSELEQKAHQDLAADISIYIYIYIFV
jgi:hypothetical protein